MPDWYPEGLAAVGKLFVWRISRDQTLFNSVPVSELCLGDLDLQPMQPIEVSFQILSPSEHDGGMIVFGKSFGQYNQDIRLRVVYESDKSA